jgi:hypothetical protein
MKDEELSYNIKNNIFLFKFASNILFEIIKRCKEVKLDKKYIISLIKENHSQKKYIEKFGISCCYNKIIDCNDFKDFYNLIEMKHFSFRNITGAIYKFSTNPKFITLNVDYDISLQKKVLNKFKTYFNLPSSFKYSDLKNLIKESGGFWFMPLIITYIMVDKENLVRKNLTRNDGEYIRNIITNPKKKYMEICKNFLTHEDRYCKNKSKVFALKGNTYYSVKKGSIYYNLAKKYNKKITTGVSGSAIMIYQLFFIVLKILKNNKINKIIVLLLIIGDFCPLHHSISEILSTYVNEAELPKYDLSMNDTKYVLDLLKENLPDLYYMLSFNYNGKIEKKICFKQIDDLMKNLRSNPALIPSKQIKIRNFIPRNCLNDVFHPLKNTIQFIIGNFNIDKNFLSNCNKYYIINSHLWSIFRNNLLINYLSKENSGPVMVDNIFPLRIILSENSTATISTKNYKYIKHIAILVNEYFEKSVNIIDGKKFKSKKLRYKQFKKSRKNRLSDRKKCILNRRKIYFYVILYKNRMRSFLLASKYNKNKILKWYENNNIQINKHLKLVNLQDFYFK